MKRNYKRAECSRALVLVSGLICLLLATSCGRSTDESMAVDRGAAESECRQLASARSGYDPSSQAGGSSIGKGAAIGAASGAAVGAITSDKSKKVVQGAAIGAAAGAGAGAIKDSEDKKKAEKAAAAYQAELKHCMSGKGF